MVEISNAKADNILRLLDTLDKSQENTHKGREVQRQCRLMSRYLNKMRAQTKVEL